MAKAREMKVKFDYPEDAEKFQVEAEKYIADNTPTYDGKGVTMADLMLMLPGTHVIREEDEHWGWDDALDDPDITGIFGSQKPYKYSAGKYWVVVLPGMTLLY